MVHSWYSIFSTVIKKTDLLSEILRFDFCETLRPFAKITAFDSAYAKSTIQDETVRWLYVYVNPFMWTRLQFAVNLVSDSLNI